jgi:hypothetical protein
MSKGALIEWKEESEVIHREMDDLLKRRWLESAEDRRARRLQFSVLIKRRDAAARRFLEVKR